MVSCDLAPTEGPVLCGKYVLGPTDDDFFRWRKNKGSLSSAENEIALAFALLVELPAKFSSLVPGGRPKQLARKGFSFVSEGKSRSAGYQPGPK